MHSRKLQTDEDARISERSRAAALSVLESLYISHEGDLVGARLMDLFQLDFDENGNMLGFEFLPNTSFEESS